MDRINGAGHVGNMFVSEDPAINRPPTEITAEWMNSVQEELVSVILAAGFALNQANSAQVLAAINALIEARVGDYALSTGTANAKVIALNPAIASYTANFSGILKVNSANTGACTLNAGGGAKALVNDRGAALVANDLVTGMIVNYQYILADDKFYVVSAVTSQQLTQAAADARYAQIYTPSWQDMSASRAIGTTYTNATGREIEVSISASYAGAASSFLALTVGGILVAKESSDVGGYSYNSQYNVIATIPAGATYVVTSTAGMAETSWAELR